MEMPDAEPYRIKMIEPIRRGYRILREAPMLRHFTVELARAE